MFKWSFLPVLFFLLLPNPVSAHVPDSLRDAILALQTLTGETTDSIATIDDINNDNTIGLAEAIFALRSLIRPWFSPTNLTASPLSDGAIRLSWQDQSEGETSFEIQEKRTDTGDFAIIETVASNTMLYTVSALTNIYLQPDTQYQFRVRAVDDTQETAYSNIAVATTKAAATTPPTPPTSLQAEAQSYSTIVVSWVDNSNNESLFRLEQSKGCNNTYSKLTDIVADSTIHVIGGLNPNQEYCYRLRTENEAGESDWSNTARATTTINADLPSIPTNFQAEYCKTPAGLVSVTLNWTDNAENEQHYRLDRQSTVDGSNPPWVIGSDLPADTELAGYGGTPVGARPTQFLYRLTAFNDFGQTPYVYKGTFTYSGHCIGYSWPVPEAPNPAAASALSASSIRITWTNVEYEDNYLIYRSLNANSGFSLIMSVGSDIDVADNIGLEENTTYYYKIEAKNSSGVSESNVVSATTEGVLTIPQPPTNLSIDAIDGSSSSLKLTWTDNSDNEFWFRIYRSTDSSSGFVPLPTQVKNVTEFTDTGLTPCTTYYYKIFASNTAGDSNTFAGGDKTTPPASPENLIVSEGSVLHAIYLNWTEDTCAEGYNLYEYNYQSETWDSLNNSLLTSPMADIVNTEEGVNITPGKVLFYQITSVDSGGNEGSPSAYKEGWAGSPVPQSVSASRGLYPDKISLQWEPVQVCPNDQGVTASFAKEYDIYWSDSLDGTNGWVKFKTVVLPGIANSDGTVPSAPARASIDIQNAEQGFPGVTPGNQYYFSISSAYRDDLNCDHVADNGSIPESQPSNAVTGWAQQQTANYLPAPAWVQATSGTYTTKIVVSWAAVSGAASYKVYRGPSSFSFGPWTHIRTIAGTSFTNSTSDTSYNIIPGATYFYFVVPVDSNGIEGFPSGYDGGFAVSDVLNR